MLLSRLPRIAIGLAWEPFVGVARLGRCIRVAGGGRREEQERARRERDPARGTSAPAEHGGVTARRRSYRYEFP